MKVQRIYERALDLVGRTEEGTSHPFAGRAPSLINGYAQTLNLVRETPLSLVDGLLDEVDANERELDALAHCLAVDMALEIEDYPELRARQLLEARNRCMGAFTTGMRPIPERWLMH